MYEGGGRRTKHLVLKHTNIWPLLAFVKSVRVKNRSSQLGSRRASGSRSRGQGSTSSGTMVRMTSSLPRLTTVRSVSSRLMVALTSLAEVTGSPLMLMMTSLSRRPALSQQKSERGGGQKKCEILISLKRQSNSRYFAKETLVLSLVVLVLDYLIQFKTHLGQIILN